MIREISRREAMRLGAYGLGGAVLVGGSPSGVVLTDGATTTTSPTTPESSGEFVPLPEISSVNGILTAAIVAKVGSATINGEAVSGTYTYNGLYPSETWRVRPGDVFRIALTNDLDAFTNLHWHGMHVSPNGNSDNIFLQIAPGRPSISRSSYPPTTGRASIGTTRTFTPR